MDEIIDVILDSLDDTFLKPIFLKIPNRSKLTGHCYVATEALYYLLSDDDKLIYRPAVLKIDNITHWFLKNKINNTIIDITKSQFNFELDYAAAKNCAFLTQYPSKRTLRLINKIYERTNN
jgi:hypothetical protein